MHYDINYGRYNELNPNTFNDLLTLRHKVFIGRLNWELSSNKGREQDEYDTPSASYIYVRQEEAMVGCWRIIPTTSSYMLKDTFNTMQGDAATISDPNICELSRFAVDKDSVASSHKISDVTVSMFKGVQQYAHTHRVKEYITVTSLAVERILKRIGLPFERFGDQKVHKLGDTKSVALRFMMNDEFDQWIVNNS
ncbi:acyl-homoserine-lactone synthase [Vibrio sp. MACH09]|uniref:acyl-homoserine-lactone synthase n=1 Tax=unclassified Vibrio TaxID=2614977 RepID=UPI001493506C|nr:MULTISPECIES: acyl-homoserine-lactone synthase [unclassified Vibrio]NOI68518.1 GNAT family N-acetyltransferase [Vibrio sp. 99-8-1]GLO59523.1 acyl-homoserine-lactone synthase [Vibrio sp. MACH09]